MQKCKELSRLPKASQYKSVIFRRQTPGSVEAAIISKENSYLDQSHPAAASRHKLPTFNSLPFRLNAYPMALLSKPDQYTSVKPPFDTWQARMERFSDGSKGSMTLDEPMKLPSMELQNQKVHRFPISFACVTSIKATSSKKSVRVKLNHKLRTAINLIVVRNAQAGQAEDGTPQLILRDAEAGGDAPHILRGWTYVFWPRLDIYQMPYHQLIPALRKGLEHIWEQGSELEAKWEKDAIETIQSTSKTAENATLTKKANKTATPTKPKRSFESYLEQPKDKPKDEEWLGWFRSMADSTQSEDPNALEFEDLMEKYSPGSKTAPQQSPSPPSKPEAEPERKHLGVLFKPKRLVLELPSPKKNNRR